MEYLFVLWQFSQFWKFLSFSQACFVCSAFLLCWQYIGNSRKQEFLFPEQYMLRVHIYIYELDWEDVFLWVHYIDFLWIHKCGLSNIKLSLSIFNVSHHIFGMCLRPWHVFYVCSISDIILQSGKWHSTFSFTHEYMEKLTSKCQLTQRSFCVTFSQRYYLCSGNIIRQVCCFCQCMH